MAPDPLPLIHDEHPITQAESARHGTRYRYTVGCRCELCKAWNAANARAKYRRRRARERENNEQRSIR